MAAAQTLQVCFSAILNENVISFIISGLISIKLFYLYMNIRKGYIGYLELALTFCKYNGGGWMMERWVVVRRVGGM